MGGTRPGVLRRRCQWRRRRCRQPCHCSLGVIRTREPCFACGETDEARSGAAKADPVGSTRCRQWTCPSL